MFPFTPRLRQRCSGQTINNKGFSLIEILVATAIFSVVMTISIGAVVSINDSNKKAQITRTVMDNLNFAMENIARNLRVGRTFHCDVNVLVPPKDSPRNCSLGASSIFFEGYKGDLNNGNDQIAYRLNETTHQVERSLDSGVSYLSITSTELSIDTLKFYVTGAEPGDQKQPRVVIVISGSAIFKNGIKSSFNIQTTVSQRKLDS